MNKLVNWCLYEFFWINVSLVFLVSSDTPLIKVEFTLPLIIYFCFVTVIGTIIFIKEDNESRIKKVFAYIFAIAILIDFIIEYFLIKRPKSALYEVMLPSHVVMCGLIAFEICWIINLVKYKKKIDISVKKLLLGLMVVITFVYPLIEIYYTNISEFDFSMAEISGWTIMLCIFIFIVIQQFGSTFVYIAGAISLCGYIQEMLLNKELFLMDGNELQWTNSLRISNIIIWAAGAIILYFLLKQEKDTFEKLVQLVAVTVIGMQMVGMLSLVVASNDNKTLNKTTDYFSVEGITEVAKENIVWFVLDTFDIDYWDEILNEDKSYLDRLEGFIQFRDNISMYSRTNPSIQYMLSGKEYFFEIPKEEYNQTAMDDCILWKELVDNKYAIYMYEEDSDYISNAIKGEIANYVYEGKEISKRIASTGVWESILRISNYRTAPYLYKQGYRYTSNEINELIIKEHIYDKEPFKAIETCTFDDIKQNGLNLSDRDKAFRFIHLNGVHAPYRLTADCKEVIKGQSSLLNQAKASLLYVFQYLEYMKESGVYDDSMIIITADHGENFVAEELSQNTNPILFVKPFKSKNDKLIQSDLGACQEDLIPTIRGQIGEKQADYDKGIDLLDGKQEQNRQRYHYFSVVKDGVQIGVNKYIIEGNSLEFDNWKKTEDFRQFKYYK